jgi:glycosyltransferase involved in cell wall biosynthesis
VLETIAAHKPLITTNVGGIPEVLTADTLVVPNDAAALANRMLQMLADRAKADADAKSLAHKFSGSMSASQMSQKITSFYEALM